MSNKATISSTPLSLSAFLFTTTLLMIFLSGCGRKRSDGGPWEYAELSQRVSFVETSGSGQQTNSDRTIVFRFETGSSSFEAPSITSLLEKLGKEKPKEECTTAILDELDKDGWQVIDHSMSSTHTAGGVGGAGFGVAIHEAANDSNIWTLRRSR
jgi:hypothetical protein